MREVLKTCAVCGKNFVPTHNWAYKKGHKYYCRYNCYKQAGGDGGVLNRNYIRERATNIKHKKIEQ